MFLTPPDEHEIVPGSTAEAFAFNASKSSTCQKSHRGCVIYNPKTKFWAIGYNSPPKGFICEGRCMPTCNKYAIHAEQMCIDAAYRFSDEHTAFGCYIVHVKSVNNQIVPSGGPSCWQCSRAMLEADLEGIWLYHENGWKLYETMDFHKQTLANCNINY